MSDAPLAHGRSSVVYAIDDDRVIKVFLPEVTDAEIAKEVHDAHLAHEIGATPIASHGLAEHEGKRGLVLDRIHGIALTAVAERNIILLREVGRRLAREHARLHRLKGSDLPDVRDLAAGMLDTAPFDALTGAEKDSLRAYLAALPAGERVLHLDFHPQNVFTHHAGVAIIDWQSTCVGHPAADVAMTRYLFTEAELFPGIGAAKKLLYGTVRRIMHGAYASEYAQVTGLATADVDRWMTAARILRLGLLDVASEHDDLIARLRDAAA